MYSKSFCNDTFIISLMRHHAFHPGAVTLRCDHKTILSVAYSESEHTSQDKGKGGSGGAAAPGTMWKVTSSSNVFLTLLALLGLHGTQLTVPELYKDAETSAVATEVGSQLQKTIWGMKLQLGISTLGIGWPSLRTSST